MYEPTTTPIDMGCSAPPGVVAPAEDRNRTSPFPYGGFRFEFRAVGSSQNVAFKYILGIFEVYFRYILGIF